jgi:hypothetical protein
LTDPAVCTWRYSERRTHLNAMISGAGSACQRCDSAKHLEPGSTRDAPRAWQSRRDKLRHPHPRVVLRGRGSDPAAALSGSHTKAPGFARGYLLLRQPPSRRTAKPEPALLSAASSNIYSFCLGKPPIEGGGRCITGGQPGRGPRCRSPGDGLPLLFWVEL